MKTIKISDDLYKVLKKITKNKYSTIKDMVEISTWIYVSNFKNQVSMQPKKELSKFKE